MSQWLKSWLKAVLFLSVSFLLLGTASVYISGCTQQEIRSGAKAAVAVAGGAAALSRAEESYEAAKLALESQAARFPEETQQQLRQIGQDADTLIQIAKRRTGTASDTLTFVAGDGETFYVRFRALYLAGKDLVAPYRESLDSITQLTLDELTLQMGRLDEAHVLYSQNPTAQAAADMAKLTLEGVSIAMDLARVFSGH